VPFVDLRLRRKADEGPSNPVERDAQVEYEQTRPPVRERLTAEGAQDWHVIAQVDGAEELLVTYAPEAIAFGLAERTVADDRELAAHFGALTVTRSDENFGDALVRFLTGWPVRLVLVIVLLGGFFVEIAAPGVGWFGAASTAALVLLVGAPALGGVSTWWPLLVVVLGALLVVIEVFLIPGVGLVGFLGGACIVVGLVASFLDAPIATEEGRADLATAIGIVAGGGILAVGAAWGLLRTLPRSPFMRAAVLEATAGGGAMPSAPSAGMVAVGRSGIALTPLRPVGKAEFGGAIVEVQAVGPFVDEGTRIVVVRSTAYAVEVEEDRRTA
jgi:membrane-bound serine protease (ClpP class)